MEELEFVKNALKISGERIRKLKSELQKLENDRAILMKQKRELENKMPFCGVDIDDPSPSSVVDKTIQNRVWNAMNEKGINLQPIMEIKESMFWNVDNVRCLFNDNGHQCPHWLRQDPRYNSFIEPDDIY